MEGPVVKAFAALCNDCSRISDAAGESIKKKSGAEMFLSLFVVFGLN